MENWLYASYEKIKCMFSLLTISATFCRYTLARNDEDNARTLIYSSLSPPRRRLFRSLSIFSKRH